MAWFVARVHLITIFLPADQEFKSVKIKILSGPGQTIQPAAAARPHRVSRSDISDQAVSCNYYSLSVVSVFYFAERKISAEPTMQWQ